MGRSRYKFLGDHYPYLITSTVLVELPLLSKPEIPRIVLDQFVFIQEERVRRADSYYSLWGLAILCRALSDQWLGASKI